MLDALEDRGIEDALALRRAARAPPGSTRTGSTACRRSPARRRGKALRVGRRLADRARAGERAASSPPSACASSSRRSRPTRTWTAAASSQADVHEGLESTLVMLGHKLKHTADQGQARLRQVAAEADDARLRAQPGLDEPARQRDRRARRGRHDHDHDAAPTTAACSVDIADDGPGIPADVRTHIFDPFFTTKAPGSGTGMGLDTARRIVEQRHRGSLDVRHRRRRHDLPRLAAPGWSEAMTQLHPPGHDRDHRAAGGGRRLRGLPGDRRRLAAPADLPRVRARRLLRRLAQQARDRARLGREHPIIRSLEPGEDWCWCFEDRDRDADPAGHRDDADPALADAVALNSASAAASTRPSLHGGAGELDADRQAELVEADRHGGASAGRRGPAGPCRAARRRGSTARRRRAPPAAARGSASAAGRRRRTRARSSRGCARGSAVASTYSSSVTVRAALDPRGDVLAVLVPAGCGNELGVGERGLDRLDRRRTPGRCRSASSKRDLERVERARRRARTRAGCRASSGCRCRSGQTAIARRAASPCARLPVSAS